MWSEFHAFDSSVHALVRLEAPACPHHVYKNLLRACNRRKSLSLAKQIYAHLAFHRLHLSPALGNYLVVTLAACGAVEDACSVFDHLAERTVYAWTALISAYTERGHASSSLQLHQCMKEDGVLPDQFTFASLFKACGSIFDVHAGRELHFDAEKRGILTDIVVGNSIISMYGKCGFIADAEFVFQSLSERVIASWNAMIAVYVDQGHERKALQLFRQMWEDGIGPNKYTFASVLLACGSAIERYDDRVLDGSFSKLLLFEIGQALHAYARNLDLATEPYVITALLNLYGKGGTIKEVENTFTQCLHHDVVLWSSVLYAYVDQGHGVHALLFFQEMQRRGIEPDQHTFVIVLQACGIIAEQEKGLLFEEQLVKVMSLDIARALHNDARRRGFISDSFVCNILINVYGKCGSIKEAEDIFSGMPVRDIVTSTSMLTALVEQGNGYKAFLFYKQMLEEDTMVNDINLLCILQGCVEAGSIEMCRELHFVVASAELDIDIPLAATVMNAYGSCASMVDAEVVLEGLSHPDIVPWSVCIAGHAEGLECFASLRVFEESQCLGICCDEAAFASVIASCSRGGLVDHGLLYFVSLGRNYQITPGVKHYGCVIDLLARAGAFNKVKRILDIMPVNPDLNLLLSLLSACRLHGNVELGQWAFENAVRLQPTQTAAYALMSNMCCDP